MTAVGILFLFLYLPTHSAAWDYDRANVVPAHSPNAHDSESTSYGVIVDAGSTGSRLFLYRWTNDDSNALIRVHPVMDPSTGKPVVKKVTPGLSSFAERPEDAADYLRPLLAYAEEHVPVRKRSSTSVTIFATAGMRLLSKDDQEAILSGLRKNLPKATSLAIRDEDIRVISGRWEGVYSWIAVNYLLGRFGPVKEGGANEDHESTTVISLPSGGFQTRIVRRPTVGMIDMGGASVQIAFEMPHNETFSSPDVEAVNLGWRTGDDRFKYRLFVTTFLGYGVNEAARLYERRLAAQLSAQQPTAGSSSRISRDPCLPLGLQQPSQPHGEDDHADGGDGDGGDNKTATPKFVRKGTGDWLACERRLAELLAESGGGNQTICNASSTQNHHHCLFGGVRAPLTPLSRLDIYGFSEYWFSLDNVLALGGVYNYSDVMARSRAFCSQRWTVTQQRARAALYPRADDDRLRSQCFKSAWCTAVLHDGFRLDRHSNHFRSALTLDDGQEVQWALGALIHQRRFDPSVAGEQTGRHLEDGARPQSPSSVASAVVQNWPHGFVLVVLLLGLLLLLVVSCSRRRRGGTRLHRRGPSLSSFSTGRSNLVTSPSSEHPLLPHRNVRSSTSGEATSIAMA